MPVAGPALLELAEADAADHFAFTDARLGAGLEATSQAAALLRSMPATGFALETQENAFDFSSSGMQGGQLPAGTEGPGAVAALDPSWTHQLTLESVSLDAALSDSGGVDPGTLDHHAPDRFGESHPAALDEVTALGADGMRMG
jgi:hypothetical protein